MARRATTDVRTRPQARPLPWREGAAGGGRVGVLEGTAVVVERRTGSAGPLGRHPDLWTPPGLSDVLAGGSGPTAEQRLWAELADRVDPDATERAVPWPEYEEDPVGFIREVLGVMRLTEDQVAICRRVRDYPETNVQAGHGVGKSFIVACLVIWWVFSVGGLAVTTAPTKAQVNDILWHEVRKLYDENESKLGGQRLETRLYLTEGARAYGFTAGKRGKGVSFGGRHAEKLLAVQDEASGIVKPIDDAFDSTLTGAGNRGVRIGNPLDEASPFGQHCKKPGTIHVPVWEHPNVEWAYREDEEGVHVLRDEVDEALPRDAEGNVADESEWPAEMPRSVIPGAVSVQWIEKQRRTPGRGPGSLFWQMRLDAEFADNPVESLVPRGWFNAARARYDADPERWQEVAQQHGWQHGLDVGDGQDPHMLASGRGPVLERMTMMQTQGDMDDTDRAVALVVREVMQRWGTVKVDRYGNGSAVVSALRKTKVPHKVEPEDGEDEAEWSQGEDRVRAFPVMFGDKATEPDLYMNLKAEAFWKLRQMFMEGEIAIAPLGPEMENRLREELAAIRYSYTRNGKLRLERKEKTRKRLGRSTDAADALAYEMWDAGLDQEITVAGYGKGDKLPGVGIL